MEELTAQEVRVLGCLMEKEQTTPDYYPMTLNALTNACNQKSNRDPAVNFDEKTVVRALNSLRERKLAWMISTAGGRVPKYEHRATEAWHLSAAQAAVLCELMLRGPQTTGELKTRAGRLYAFETRDDVQDVINDLSEREPAIAATLPRAPGHKEARHTHLLSGLPEVAEEPELQPTPEPARIALEQENERFRALQQEVQTLRSEVQELRDQFQQFRQQFE